MKKILLICLAILLSLQSTTFAKSLPENERIKIALEISDSSKHQELGTANNLEKGLSDKLVAKNLLNIVVTKIFPEDKLIFEEESSIEKNSPAESFGDLLIFDAMELPVPSDVPEDFERTFYKELNVDYVIRCQVLALGLTKVEDKTLSTIFGATGAITTLSGSWTNGSKGRTLRRIGTAVGLGGFIQTERTALSTVVNLQFISVETGQVLWQENFVGLGIKHHKPSKDYDEAWQQAYDESVDKTTKKISERVNKYVDKVIIKGKSDKSFQQKNISVGALGGARF